MKYSAELAIRNYGYAAFYSQYFGIYHTHSLLILSSQYLKAEENNDLRPWRYYELKNHAEKPATAMTSDKNNQTASTASLSEGFSMTPD